MSTWAALGLPYPETSGYKYSIDAGLLRSSISTAQPRQKRQYETNQRSFSVSWVVSYEQLQIAEPYLQQHGYSWFPLQLLSGYLPEPIVTLCVRLTDDYSVEPAGAGHYRIKATLEQLVERSVLVTTHLYPLEYVDEGGSSLPATGFFGDTFRSVFSEVASSQLPTTFSGTYVLTVYTHPIGPPTGQPVPAPGEPYPYPGADLYGRAEAETGASAYPTTFSGTYVQTIFWNRPEKGIEDATSQYPTTFSGTYVQTVFWAYITATDERGESATSAYPTTFSGTLVHS